MPIEKNPFHFQKILNVKCDNGWKNGTFYWSFGGNKCQTLDRLMGRQTVSYLASVENQSLNSFHFILDFIYNLHIRTANHHTHTPFHSFGRLNIDFVFVPMTSYNNKKNGMKNSKNLFEK